MRTFPDLAVSGDAGKLLGRREHSDSCHYTFVEALMLSSTGITSVRSDRLDNRSDALEIQQPLVDVGLQPLNGRAESVPYHHFHLFFRASVQVCSFHDAVTISRYSILEEQSEE